MLNCNLVEVNDVSPSFPCKLTHQLSDTHLVIPFSSFLNRNSRSDMISRRAHIKLVESENLKFLECI